MRSYSMFGRYTVGGTWILSLWLGVAADARPIPRKQCVALLDDFNELPNREEAAKSALRQLEASWGSGSLFEIQQKASLAAIQEHNASVQAALAAPLPPIKTKLARRIIQDQARTILAEVHQTPSHRSQHKYQIRGCNGYCFGRAVIAHIEALRRELHPESIKKLWAIGSMQGNNAFHVTTLAPAKGARGIKWWSLDANSSQPTDVNQWMSQLAQMSTDQRLMFFVTDGYRFSPHADVYYNEWDLFGTSSKQDYYAGYFLDYFRYIKQGPDPEPF